MEINPAFPFNHSYASANMCQNQCLFMLHSIYWWNESTEKKFVMRFSRAFEKASSFGAKSLHVYFITLDGLFTGVATESICAYGKKAQKPFYVGKQKTKILLCGINKKQSFVCLSQLHTRVFASMSSSLLSRRCKSKCWKSKESEMNWQFAYISVFAFFLPLYKALEWSHSEGECFGSDILWEYKSRKSQRRIALKFSKKRSFIHTLSCLGLHYIDYQQPSNSWNDFKVTSTEIFRCAAENLNLNFTKLSCLETLIILR